MKELYDPNVRFGEIIALEEKWRVQRFGQRVRETVAEIQPCRVTASAKSLEGLDCRAGQCFVHSHDRNIVRFHPRLESCSDL